jgi:hypothetical protein
VDWRIRWSRRIDLTREIFGGFSRVTVSEDPDFGDTHIIFHVPADDTRTLGLVSDSNIRHKKEPCIP